MLFRMLYDDKLAQASYLIGCQKTGEALVVDPERDIDRYTDLAKNEGLRITAIAETHIHADFLSGARELTERTNAKLYLSDEGDKDWKYTWVKNEKMLSGKDYNYKLLKNNDTFRIGNIELKAVWTPGHTPEHLSFLVTDLGGGAEEPMGIVTGDFVFVGDVGRPDLLESAAGQVGVKEKSAKVLHKSLKDFKILPDYMQVWPAHGSGSACGKALGAVPQSTVGYEKKFNKSILLSDNEEDFVDFILYGQPEPPVYFSRMKKENKEGPKLLGQLPKPKKMSAEELLKNRGSKGALIDTRGWEKFSDKHIKGSLFTPMDNSFPSVTGSYINDQTPIYIIAEDDKIKEIVTDLIRIGLDIIPAYTTPKEIENYIDAGGEYSSIDSRSIDELKGKTLNSEEMILDVRKADEYQDGHLNGAVNIAYTRLLPRLNEVSSDKTIYVHCRTSNRSAYASAMLHGLGYKVVHLRGGYNQWLEQTL